MVDKEKLKNYLFNELPKMNLFKEAETKLGYDLIAVIDVYVHSISKYLKTIKAPMADKISGAILLGFLIRDYILIEDQRELFENCFKSIELEDVEDMYNQYPSYSKPKFMTYDEFLKRFKTDCLRINKKELGINNPINCDGFKCMSLQCYCAFKDAYYGE